MRSIPFMLGHLRLSLSFFHLLPLLLLPGHLVLDEMVLGPPGQGARDLWQALLFLTAIFSPLLSSNRLLPSLSAPHTAPLLALSRRSPFFQTGIKSLALFLNGCTHLLSIWISGLLLLWFWGIPPSHPDLPLASALLIMTTACMWGVFSHAFLSAPPALFLAGSGLILGYLLPPLAQAMPPQSHPIGGTLLTLLSLPVPDLGALEQLLTRGSGSTIPIWSEWLCKCALLFTLASRSRRA